MLIVGDGVNIKKFTDFVVGLEADLGSEISYVILSKEEFSYRMEMLDKFLGDIIDYPHYKIINKIRM